MYFANASFIKDMLLAYVTDLEDVNRTEYLVLEMTPVVSIDSTAVHVIHDIVNDFRSRGIQTAFAMVGNRVEKTLDKAKMIDFIGQQWFFPTVNDAVHWCLRHQAAKKLKNTHITNVTSEDVKQVQGVVTTGNEIGFSNDMHHDCTMLFISLLHDIPMVMSEITAVFRRNKISVVRAEIEPKGEHGAKHNYLVQSLKTGEKNRVGSKLLDHEIDRIREELGVVLTRHRPSANGNSPRLPMRQVSDGMIAADNARIAALEDQLRSQGERLERLMQLQEAKLLGNGAALQKPAVNDTSAESRAEMGEAATYDEGRGRMMI
eukprot:TRINITY_DN1514_c1_g1_i7.p2 TRINITY_DN1514_c1_g1~~TRINITY_DN1514_c1_g1_i7.p2  ORF type:complete len:318 (+),score=69.33 TRINITY_DN1514_c1_g1_i7:1835-2788(+)